MMFVVESPTGRDPNATRLPSGDQIGVMSLASSKVKRVARPSRSRSMSQMSFWSPMSDTAAFFPSGDSARSP